MKHNIISTLLILIAINLYSQPIGFYPRAFNRPVYAGIDHDVKVVDFQTGNCELEPGCNTMYPVLIEEFDYPADLPNKWRFDLGYTRDDNVSGKTDGTGRSTWMGDALSLNHTATNPLNSENYDFNAGIMTLMHIYKPVNRNGGIDYNFTSGMIKSLSKYRTGSFMARIKVPSANKMFPAFWLLGSKGPYVETDIFEYFDDDVSGSSCSNYNDHRMSTHNGDGTSNSGGTARINRADKYPQNIDVWHDYKLVWNDYETIIYVDNAAVARGYTTRFFKLFTAPEYYCNYGESGHPLDPAININCGLLNSMPDNLLPTLPYINFGPRPWWLPSFLNWPPPQPPQPYLANRVSKEKIFPDKHSAMDLIINNWANSKYATETFSGFTQSSLNMQIDWVKVYQPFCCGIDKGVCSLADFDTQTYDTDILTGRKINIGLPNNSCTFIQNTPGRLIDPNNPLGERDWRDIPVILLATDEIAIQGDAIFPGGTYAEMRITDCGSAQRLSNQEEIANKALYDQQSILLDSINRLNQPLYDSILSNYKKTYLDSIKKEYKIINEDDITIYPSPASEYISINTSEWNYEKIVSLYLIDIAGQEFLLKKEHKINIENIQAGSYLLKIIYDDGKYVTKKVIKI